MRVKFIHPDTKEEMVVEAEELDINKLREDFKAIIPKNKILNHIDNLNIPAEVKLILTQVADFSITVGNTVLSVGIKILEIVMYFIKKFPNTVIGTVIGAVLGLLFSSIPILGWALGWLIAPLFLALGLAVGFWNDVQQNTIKQSVQAEVDDIFEMLKKVQKPQEA